MTIAKPSVSRSRSRCSPGGPSSSVFFLNYDVDTPSLPGGFPFLPSVVRGSGVSFWIFCAPPRLTRMFLLSSLAASA